MIWLLTNWRSALWLLLCACVAWFGAVAHHNHTNAVNAASVAEQRQQIINQLHAKNEALASSVQDLFTALARQNAILSQAVEQRTLTTQQNRRLQDEIRHDLAAEKCAAAPVDSHAVDRLRAAAQAANGIPRGNKPAAQPADRADAPY